jgi:hypothetical protein
MSKRGRKPQVPFVGFADVSVTEDMVNLLEEPDNWTAGELDDFMQVWSEMGYTYSLKLNLDFELYEASLYGSGAECVNAGIKLTAKAPTWQEANQLLVLKFNVVGLDSWLPFVGSSEATRYR